MLEVELLSYIGSIFLLIGLYLSRKNALAFNVATFIGSIFLCIWSGFSSLIPILILNIVYGGLALYNIWKLRQNEKAD